MAAELREALGVEPQLREGRGGIFNVEVDGRSIFSKYQEGRFPGPGEVLRRLEGG